MRCQSILPPGSLLRQETYRIDHALGQGGFGITYQGVHLTLQHQVAIKELFPQDMAVRDPRSGQVDVSEVQRDLYQRLLDRFLSEGKILARVSHPSPVRVSDLFQERGTAYLVMELVTGRTLRQDLRSVPEGRLRPGRVGEILGQLVRALETIHQAGVCHLDIKPDNILVTPDGRTVLVDFGAARQGFGQSSRSTQPLTLDYAPLELVTGEELDPRTDLFQLGMVVHELLTGSLAPPALARLRPALKHWEPENLEEPWRSLVRSALQLSKDARPASVRAWWESRREASSKASSPAAVPSAPRVPGDAPAVPRPSLDGPGGRAPPLQLPLGRPPSRSARGTRPRASWSATPRHPTWRRISARKTKATGSPTSTGPPGLPAATAASRLRLQCP